MLVDLLLITDQDDLKKRNLENLIDLIVRYHPGIVVSSPKHGFTGTNQVYVLRDFDCNFIVSESFLTVTVSKQLSGRVFLYARCANRADFRFISWRIATFMVQKFLGIAADIV
jgi:hypothetical protein